MKANAIISLDKLPAHSDIHLWADFIELLCLCNLDGYVSKADVLDRYEEIMGTDKSEEQDASSSDERNDIRSNRLELKSDDWFGHLAFRAGTFGGDDFYPFEMTSDGDALVRKDELTLKHKLYIFLLIASNLRYTPTLRDGISSDFEAICEVALKKCLPYQAEVYIFGTGGLPDSKKLSGNLFKKITKLADLLNERVIVEEKNLSHRNVGDGGLDIVGWVPMGDSARGLFCIFGQCACDFDNWVVKQHSSRCLLARMVQYTLPMRTRARSRPRYG